MWFTALMGIRMTLSFVDFNGIVPEKFDASSCRTWSTPSSEWNPLYRRDYG